MRVLFCKLHCPSFICFCKPSPHLYTPGPLKLQNTPHVPSTVVSATDASEQQSREATEDKEEIIDVKQEQQQEEEEEEEEEVEDCPKSKSSLKKVTSEQKEVHKKKVQWMDFLGKELVEIREFESNETEDIDYENEYNRSCVCIIL